MLRPAFVRRLKQSANIFLAGCLFSGFVQAGGPLPILEKSGLPAAVQAIVAKHDMDRQTLESLLAEFEAMRQTDAEAVDQFTVRFATPARLDQLYQWPEVALLPRSLRENGLIFAGHPDSGLLRFKRPSDILRKVSLWFPEELAGARANRRLSQSNIHLWGPFANWSTEASAFLALWNCMPQAAWLQAEQSPFRRVQQGPAPLTPLAARSSDYNEFDFGQCVREKNGYRSSASLEKLVQQKKWTRALGDKVVPVLQGKFLDFLRENRCRGSGPDDCVLLMHLWASLTPDDPKLAAMIQSLEREAGLGAPLPAMKKPYREWSPKDVDAGAERFDEVWRRAALIRAKFVSILGNPQAWPENALQLTIRQLIDLQLALHTPYAYHFDYVDMDYRTPASSPWLVLYSELRRQDRESGNGQPLVLQPWRQMAREPASLRRLQASVVEELGKLSGPLDCRIFEPWLTPVLHAEIDLQQRLSPHNRLGECVKPDWSWLIAGATEEAASLRSRYIGQLTTLKPPLREMLLSRLTHDGNDCFASSQTPAPAWQRELCRTWIHEPTMVSLQLKNSRLVLDKARAFQKIAASRPADERTSQLDWLSALADGLPAESRSRLRAYAAELDRQQLRVESTTLWRHAGHSRALIELALAGGDCPRRLLLLTPAGLREISVPQRIWREAQCHSEIVRVSDLDQDGNLEIWWPLENWGAAKFDACQGNDDDLVRSLDCSATNQQAKMGEISEDVLTYLINNRADHPSPPAGENWTSSGQAYPLPVPVGSSRQPRSCNHALIGSVLGDKLGIAEWGEAVEGREVIDLACAPHPVNAELTLVALFHELPARPAASDEAPVGLAVAVIDIKRRRVLRLYQEVVEEDATTRIRGNSGSLVLDTARYHLAPNVRAFGVRMNIGYSPRYAEGGSSNFLTLFVEEGQRLRPVLQGLPMRSWTMTDSRGCFSNEENPASPCVIENEELLLSISPAATNAWRDLEVIAVTTKDGEAAPAKRSVVRKLRYLQGRYQ